VAISGSKLILLQKIKYNFYHGVFQTQRPIFLVWMSRECDADFLKVFVVFAAGLPTRSRSRSRRESEVFGWIWSRIPNNTGSRSRSDSDSQCC